jgi:predicted nucleic acid-binding protein
VLADSYIVDTGVLARWFLKQDGWQQARKYRDGFVAEAISLETTWCARFELPHVLRLRGLVPGHLSEELYRAGSRIIDDLGIHVETMSADEVEQCAILSARNNITFFDAVFVFRSLVTGLPLLTTDVRLAHAAQHLVEFLLVATPTEPE